MAEGLAKKLICEKNLNIQVYSAGIFAVEGEYASYNSIEIMKEYNVDIVLHKATSIENSDIENMNLILCATNNQKKSVIFKYPNIKQRVFTMKEYAEIDNNGEDMDIKDPWGNNINIFRICAAEISICVDKIINKIQNGEDEK